MQFIIITKMRQMQPLILENKRMVGRWGRGVYGHWPVGAGDGAAVEVRILY